MKFTKSILAVVMLLFAFTTAFAQGTVNAPYALKMGENQFDGSKRIVACYTVTEDGDYTFDVYGYALIGTYNDTPVEYKWGGYTAKGAHYSYTIKDMKSGEKFVLDSNWATGSKVLIEVSKIDGAKPITIESINPAQGKTYSWSADDGRVTVHFNIPVHVQSARINVNEYYQTITDINNGIGGLVSITIKPTLLKLIEEGRAKEGDEFKLVIYGIADVDDPNNLYNGDGRLELTYKIPAVQAVLTETSATILNGKLKTFYTEGDADAIFSLTFDKPIKESKTTSVSLRGGSAELEGNLVFGEDIPYTIKDNTISVDLSGKIRTLTSLYNQAAPELIAENAEFLSNITLCFNGIQDIYGNFVNSPGQGTTGSYSYDLQLTTVDMSDFFMDLGTPTDDEDPTIVEAGDELIFWFSDPNLFSLGTPMGFEIYSGETLVKSVLYRELKVTYEEETEYTDYQVIVHDDAPIAFSEMEGGSAITLTLPELDLAAGTDIKIVVVGIATADGLENDYHATYKYGEPVADGISTITESQSANASCFNIAGQRINALRNGIVIKNGKKIVK